MARRARSDTNEVSWFPTGETDFEDEPTAKIDSSDFLLTIREAVI
jgi:hypothetical protein